MGRPSPLTLEEIRPAFDRLLTGPLVLAVSGGADSIALMHLVAEWQVHGGAAAAAPPIVLTVDHGLRSESADETAWVHGQAANLGLAHVTLEWAGPKPASGLQAAARSARYRLMNDFLDAEVRDRLVPTKRSIVTAHHADDQAETFVMRLARGSGLDGLSGMRPREVVLPDRRSAASATSYTVVRPLLQTPKARLIAMLRARGLAWREDPSNASEDFERIRVRKALGILSDLGISAAQMERSTRRLARARAAVMVCTAEAACRLVRLHEGLFAEVDPALFLDVSEELQVRIFAVLLEAYGGDSPPARLSQTEALVEQMGDVGRGQEANRRRAATLGGCRIERTGDGPMLVWREAGRDGLPELDLQPGGCLVWDERFAVALGAEERQPVRVRALGADGARALGSSLAGSIAPASRQVPQGALETLPTFWRNGQIVAAPPLRTTATCSAEFLSAQVFSHRA